MSDVTPFEIGDGIMAMTEDDGTVITLLKRDPTSGAMYRHDSEWLPLVDPTVLDDLAFVGVTDSAEAVYDKYESQDELVSVGHYYPSAEGPFWPHPVTIYAEPETADEASANMDDDVEDDSVDSVEAVEEPLAASITLNSADDLDSAIAAAAADPEIRWYVERRMQALGLEARLPWLEG